MVIMRGMVSNMEEAKLRTLDQIKTFLDDTTEVAFRVPKDERNQFIERVLKRVRALRAPDHQEE